MRFNAVLLAELLAVTLVAACDATQPPVPIAPIGNDPVPFSAELEEQLERSLKPRSRELQPVDGTSPRISARAVLEIAGKHLLEELSGNNVPAQDPSAPDGLIRRLYIDRGRGARPPTSVWVVAYRWDAGFNCRTETGGPGPCATRSFYFIDDRTGEMVTSVTQTD
jgi:hypothetical protein